MMFNKNLFRKDLKRNAPGLLLWMVIITVLIVITMSVYRTFMANQSKIAAMLSIIPEGMLQFKGISNFDDLLSVLGFYAANNVIYMLVLGSLFSIVLSSGIILKEEYNKTAEFLITRPLTRNEIFMSKLGVVILNIFLLNLVTSTAGFICIWLVKTGPFSIMAFLTLAFYTLMLNVLFGAAGLFISMLTRRPRPVTFLSIGVVLIFYFIDTISKISQDISMLGYLSPFRYVDVNVIAKGYHLNLLHFAYFAGLSSIMLVISWLLYRKREIYI
jgi:ABC-2 type transport system permease protein